MELNNVHIFQTSLYSKNYKKLIKQHRYDVVDKVDEVVEKLSRGEISSQYHNHPLTNLKVNDIHITGDVILLYRWSSNNTVLTISLQLIDLTNHNKLKNSDYQKQIKKTIKNLKENKGDKKMKYMDYTPSGVNAITVEFEFKNKITEEDVRFDYEVPFETFIEAVKEYFDVHYEVTLDGRDNKIWNMLVDLGEMVNEDIIQEFIDSEDIQESLKEKVKEEAEEKFDELCQEEAEDDNLEESFDRYGKFRYLRMKDLYPLFEGNDLDEKDIKKAARIVYAVYYDENFETGFADDMESVDDLIDFIYDDFDSRIKDIQGNEPFAAHFDENDIEWLKQKLNLE